MTTLQVSVITTGPRKIWTVISGFQDEDLLELAKYVRSKFGLGTSYQMPCERFLSLNATGSILVAGEVVEEMKSCFRELNFNVV